MKTKPTRYMEIIGAFFPRLVFGALMAMVLMTVHGALSIARGATHYVAVDGSDGDGDGSSGNPWATITHALDNAASGDLILVGEGEYTGRTRLRGRFDPRVTVRAQTRYQARLRHDSTVVTCYYGQGVTLEGFDIAHDGPGAGALVIHIQDLIGEPGGEDHVGRITLLDNVLHDSYNNDILKINNGAGDVTVSGNMFYNQSGSDEHIDINSATDVIVQDNVFFNDFAGSGRINYNDTSSYIVIKDSNGDDDGNIGSRRITLRRNIFLHWEGSTGSNFVLVGEDGHPYFEARDVLVENNLILGDSANVIRAPFGVKGGKDILFRNNTVVGDLPANAYAMRLNTEGANPPNENILFYNMIWSDPTGSMGSDNLSRPNDFSDTPPGETSDFTLENNMYWNGGAAIPENAGDMVNYTDDPFPLIQDPLLPLPGAPTLPRWSASTGLFEDGSSTIRQAFVSLAETHAAPPADSPAVNTAAAEHGPSEDILGRSRAVGGAPDMGAYENQEETRDVYYVEPLEVCGGKTPCLADIQAAVDFAAGASSLIKASAGTYPGLLLDANKQLT
ncbi:MAG: hypothetical protein GY859_13455, partial [Desulfobacterales bacterium]|nr:hypothetical protein [Desulfobacterales bacterium]